jgi:hypothetical protein
LQRPNRTHDPEQNENARGGQQEDAIQQLFIHDGAVVLFFLSAQKSKSPAAALPDFYA